MVMLLVLRRERWLGTHAWVAVGRGDEGECGSVRLRLGEHKSL